jgi:hypothetical protein
MRRAWTAEEQAALCARYPHEHTVVVAAALGRSVASVYQRAFALGLHKSAAYLASPAACRTNGRQGIGSRFEKGSVPFNKGLRRPGWGPGRMKETQFKAGERRGAAARNWRPVGTIATDAEGYQRIKVREARKGEAYGFGNVRVWPLMQRHVWAEAHGPIPTGYTVCFRDGDKTNCALGNLELVSRSDLMKRNSVHNLPKPLAETIQLIGALNRQIRKRTAHASEEQDRRPA